MGKSYLSNGPLISDIKPGVLRGTPGFFRIGQTREGAWWFVTPEDEPAFLRAVAGVNRHGRAGSPPVRRSDYLNTVEGLYGVGGDGWAKGTAARLHRLGVDTVGPWADAGLVDRGFYFTALADFVRAAVPTIHGAGVRLPDVFDPAWPAAAVAHAAAVAAPWAGRRELVGWFTDEALGWGDTNPARPGLFQVCLSLEPSLVAHHAAWEFALAANGGTPEALGKRWGLALTRREQVRQLTLAETPVGGAAFADDAGRFARELARRYFSVTAKALRAADTSHLILGCRFAVPPPAEVLEVAAGSDADVVSWRIRASGTFEAQAKISAGGGPQWVTGGGLTHGDFRALPVRNNTGPTRLERLLRAGREGWVAVCRDPRTVGIEWAHWADGGHEVPPFGAGLVHTDDHEAVEHTERLMHIHEKARMLHARG
jgi:hypothetical protein